MTVVFGELLLAKSARGFSSYSSTHRNKPSMLASPLKPTMWKGLVPEVNEMGSVPFTMNFFHSPLEAHKQEPFFLIGNEHRLSRGCLPRQGRLPESKKRNKSKQKESPRKGAGTRKGWGVFEVWEIVRKNPRNDRIQWWMGIVTLHRYILIYLSGMKTLLLMDF